MPMTIEMGRGLMTMSCLMLQFIVNRQKISQHAARFMGMTKQRIAKMRPQNRKAGKYSGMALKGKTNTKRNDAETIWNNIYIFERRLKKGEIKKLD